MTVTVSALDNPILNSPYEVPERHFVIGPKGPTGEIKPGRRLSESFIPIPIGRKGQGATATPADEQRRLEARHNQLETTTSRALRPEERDALDAELITTRADLCSAREQQTVDRAFRRYRPAADRITPRRGETARKTSY